MHVPNPLDFTENHRFYIFRDFSLSAADHRMLHAVYQPMVGPAAVSLYMALFQQLPADRVGYSAMEQQRKLFLSLDAPVGEKGRKLLMDAASKLEAVGLLHTFRKYDPETDETFYHYQLQPPLPVYDFYQNQHLTMLLRDKLGKSAAVRLWQELCQEEAEECRHGRLETENVSAAFYDLFRLNPKIVDIELEQALAELAPAAVAQRGLRVEEGYSLEQLLQRLPRNSANREFVEAMKQNRRQLAAINFIAKKFMLSLADVSRLLDEEGMFWPNGELDEEAFEQKASLFYAQMVKKQEERERVAHGAVSARSGDDAGNAADAEAREVAPHDYVPVAPALQGNVTIEQYNYLLRNEPYTLMLQRFFPGVVPENVRKLFGRLDINYKLPNEVINLLIHYLNMYNLSWTQSFVDSVAADMLGKQVNSYERAVAYIREQAEYRERAKADAGRGAAGQRSGKGRKDAGRGKPSIPVASSGNDAGVTDEEYLEILKKHRLLDE